MRRTLAVLSVAISAVTAGLVSPLVLADEQVINLYSARHYPTDEALYSDFTKAKDGKAASPKRSSRASW